MVPRALTLGVAPIVSARAILVLALGPHKSDAVARALTGPVTARVPASLLRTAPGRVTWLLDEAAAAGSADGRVNERPSFETRPNAMPRAS